MAHVLTETSAFDATITAPDDGDSVTAASINTALQSLTNRTRYFNTKFTGASVTRQQNHMSAIVGSNWTFDTTNMLWKQSNIGAAGSLLLPVTNLVDGATITGYSVRLAGKSYTAAAGHVGLPATLPTAALFRLDDLSNTQLGTASDTSGTQAAYDSAHVLTATGLTEVVAETRQYFVLLTGEAGANAVANTTGVLAFTVAYSWTNLTPGG